MIDKNIPIPNTRVRYPFPDMEVGDSVIIPNRTQPQVYAAAYSWSKNRPEPKPKFTTRLLPEGVRIWRIS